MEIQFTKTCANCGFLAKVRAGMPSRTDTEPIDYEERETGNIRAANAICKVSKLSGIDLEKEILVAYDAGLALPGSKTEEQRAIEAYKEVFSKSRDDCVGWFEWNHDLTPREHYEEYRLLQLDRIHREEVKRTQSAQARDFKISLAAIILATVIGIGQIVVGWFQVQVALQQRNSPVATVESVQPTSLPSVPDTPSLQTPGASTVYP